MLEFLFIFHFWFEKGINAENKGDSSYKLWTFYYALCKLIFHFLFFFPKSLRTTVFHFLHRTSGVCLQLSHFGYVTKRARSSFRSTFHNSKSLCNGLMSSIHWRHILYLICDVNGSIRLAHEMFSRTLVMNFKSRSFPFPAYNQLKPIRIHSRFFQSFSSSLFIFCSYNSFSMQQSRFVTPDTLL